MKGAHRRHEADRAAGHGARGRARRAARPSCGRPSSALLGRRARGCARRAPRRAGAAPVRVRPAPRGGARRWPRRRGRSARSAPRRPRSAQFAAVRRTSGASSSRPFLDPGGARAGPPPTPRARRGSWRRSRRRRGRRRVGPRGPRTAACRRRSASRCARSSADSSEPADRGRGAGEVGGLVGDGLQRVQREGRRRPRRAAAPARRAATRRWCGRRSAAPGAAGGERGGRLGDRRVGHAEQYRLGLTGSLKGLGAAGQRALDSGALGSGSERAADPAGAHDHERRGRGVGAVRASAGGREIPFQFSHRRYQTVGVCGSVLVGGHRRRVRALIGSRPAQMVATPGALGLRPRSTIGGCRSTSSAAAHAESSSRSWSTSARPRSSVGCAVPRARSASTRPRRRRSDWSRPLARRARQEQRNAKLRERTKADFKARREPRARGAPAAVSGDAERRREQLVEVYREVSECTRCPLHETRTKAVFGAGNADADLMFIGEAPGAEEDRQGLPFVGRAGQLLNRAARGDRVEARGRLHRQRPEVPPAGQPRPAAGRDRGLPAVPASARSS